MLRSQYANEIIHHFAVVIASIVWHSPLIVTLVSLSDAVATNLLAHSMRSDIGDLISQRARIALHRRERGIVRTSLAIVRALFAHSVSVDKIRIRTEGTIVRGRTN